MTRWGAHSWGVVVFPGSNCDQDAVHVLKNVLHQEVRLIWHKEASLDDVDAVVLPGGFSYGDYLRTGAMARFSPVMKAVTDFAKKGGLVLGICNGFQILVESHLLPGALMRNQSLHFVCESVSLKVENNKLPFTNKYKKGEEIHLPIAHMDGNYYLDQKRLEEIEKNNQIVFRYTKNPNGSLHDIAGITNKEGNILGLMPHPERASESILGGEDGRRLFESAISVLEER